NSPGPLVNASRLACRLVVLFIREWGGAGDLNHEVAVRLVLPQLLDQQIDRGLRIQGGKDATQLVHDASLVRAQQQLVLAGAGRIDVHSREHAALGDLAVQLQLGVTRALELLEDHRVTGGAGLHHCGGDDGQAATVLDIARSTQEALRRVQGVGVHTTGQDAPGGSRGGVVPRAKSGDVVHQETDVLTLLDQALRALLRKLRGGGMLLRRAVERLGDVLAVGAALHVRDLLWRLVNEVDHDVALRVIDSYRFGDVLQDRSLTSLRRGDDERALPLTDRHDQVDHAGGQHLRGGL